MTDIVDRLRDKHCCDDTCHCDEAAAEIERLRAALLDTGASLAAAISLLERGGKKAAASDKMFIVMLDDYRKSLERARAALTAQPAAPGGDK
jgi:hypothetical protein